MNGFSHYSDVIMSAMVSQITSPSIVYSTVCSGADKKNQSSASLAFVTGIHLWPVNSPHKDVFKWKQRPATRSFDVFFDLRPNKQSSKQSWGWWFETLSHSLWRHSNDHCFTCDCFVFLSLWWCYCFPVLVVSVHLWNYQLLLSLWFNYFWDYDNCHQ